MDGRALPLRVRDGIRAIIDEHGLGHGDRVPTEAVIAERFGVGRSTAREALKLLEQDGTLEVRHGSGRYVSAVATLRQPINRLESVTEMLRAHGYAVTDRLIGAVERPATPGEAEAFGRAGAERPAPDPPPGPLVVVQLERVRLHGDEPLIWSVDVFPRALVGDVVPAEWSGSLLDVLELHGHRVVGAAAQLQAVRLPPAGRRAVGGRVASPWLRFSHRNLDAGGRVIILSEDYYRGDRFTFDLHRRRD